MRFNLYRKEFDSPTAWSVDGQPWVNGFIDIDLIINWDVKFTFVVSVINRSFCYRNVFHAIMLALESESVGKIKYELLKERTRKLGVWQSL